METIDPLKYLWREETTDWSGEIRHTVFGVGGVIPNHIYITKGTELFGYIKAGTRDVEWFRRPMRAWSPARRSFRKLSKKEILSYL